MYVCIYMRQRDPGIADRQGENNTYVLCVRAHTHTQRHKDLQFCFQHRSTNHKTLYFLFCFVTYRKYSFNGKSEKKIIATY